MIAEASGVLSGIDVAAAAFRLVGVRVVAAGSNGDRVRRGSIVLHVRGPARAILGAERTALNFLMHLSGVATATAHAVRAAGVRRGGLRIRATRKTLPGLRDWEKRAVVDGGGDPNRRDLSSALLVKSTHLDLVGTREVLRRLGVGSALARRSQVEVRTPAEVTLAVRAGVGSLLIDNARPGRAADLVRLARREARGRPLHLELSGGFTPARIRSVRRLGADAVSLGAITHSAPALPFHLRFVLPRRHRSRLR